jgi:hypothetical protein
VLTVNGRLNIRRTVYWSAQSGTFIPTDQWLGLAEHRVSPGVREMCCREARRLHLSQAKVKYAVSDGADWIAHQYQRQLPMLDEHILDYYHLREHVVQASQVLYGEGTAKATQWREEMMGHVWEHGSLVMLDRLGSYLRRHRIGPTCEALESLRDYVAKRVAMTDYPTFRQLGYDCGSGPTESLCGRLTDRLKGPGMKWDASNAEAMMALLSLYHSGLWSTYWKAQRAAA